MFLELWGVSECVCELLQHTHTHTHTHRRSVWQMKVSAEIQLHPECDARITVNLQKPASWWTLSDSSCHSSSQISLSTYNISAHFLSHWWEGHWVGFPGSICHRPSVHPSGPAKRGHFSCLKGEMHLGGGLGEEVGLPSSSLPLTEGLMCSDVAGRPAWIRDEKQRA